MAQPSARGQRGPAAPAADTLAADPLDHQDETWNRNRRLLIRLLVAFALVAPFFSHHTGPVNYAFLVPATAVFMVLSDQLVLRQRPAMPSWEIWSWLAIMIGIGVSILAVGGVLGAVNPYIIAGAAVGRLTRTPRAAVAGTACCVAGGLGVGLYQGMSYGNGLVIVLVPAMASFLAYAASRRSELVAKLRETRAELARMAVAEERLRIARDLHDLLGHSLSLITLKAELAGRVIGVDPDRAAREVAELETVARRSLSEVRAAVTSYRQPTLDGELVAARQLLVAAGMECQVSVPTSIDLDPAAEALLAWTVREGVTNVVRHSAARRATITVTSGADAVSIEIGDDGVGPAGDGGPGSGADGSGLAGLAERARAAGATVSAGEGKDGKGYRLLVLVPITAAPEAAGGSRLSGQAVAPW